MVRFMVSTYQADEQGFVFYKDVDTLVDAEVRRILSGTIAERYGGYAFVIGGRVWNSHEQVMFDPSHTRISMDTLMLAFRFVEQLNAQITEPFISCDLTEMTILRINRRRDEVATIEGIFTEEDRVIYERKTIHFVRFVQEIAKATESLLNVLKRVGVAKLDATIDQSRSNQDFAVSWQASLDRLRQFARS